MGEIGDVGTDLGHDVADTPGVERGRGGEVDEGLVEGERLDERRDLVQDTHDLGRHPNVLRHVDG